MLIFERPIVFVDFESTGVDTQKDRIVEMSLVKWFPDNSERIVKTYRVNPGIPIPAGASDVHGIKDEDIKDSPKFSQLAKGLLEFIADCDLAGFASNHFDFPLLYAEYSRCGIDWDYTKHAMIDCGNLFKIKEARTLAAAVKFYCDKELEGAHGAEADILGTVDVFDAQLEKYFSDDKNMDVEDLALITNFDKKRLDMSGLFTYAADGTTVIFGLGKNIGKKATDYDYLKWVVFSSSFPKDTKDLARKLMNEIPYK